MSSKRLYGAATLQEIILDPQQGEPIFRSLETFHPVSVKPIDANGIYPLNLPRNNGIGNLSAWCRQPAQRHAPSTADFYMILQNHQDRRTRGKIAIQYYEQQ